MFLAQGHMLLQRVGASESETWSPCTRCEEAADKQEIHRETLAAHM